ncbi:plasmid mobilization relaxosome protein MobC [Burkholderia multivorans]|uniref:Mobilization protein n=1 Tax=Burkholderia vietnamiensis (strain G4 / LMG 22486) TaxID=269482 RepID=A4JHC6_BURVG|nr:MULTISPECIES: plasmid mobilization relaxosome protein MobC [Burkholderia cepacia complex]ABO55679.1 mobilization protein [Burkholderia vietnamiensis G4]MCB4345442.1 MobC family plasmid mobilization relaxosome protein [Burkholderia vietnamiensis]MBU9692940.1 MobC family plasmid mobilization relaxosome protein [Burkholderia multivorans]MCO8554122.1 plasmid mobilization relaxosome protein MobC [Burkholderia multivorans]MCO8555485.1 plasmid mobilization relaxosome protein MobC [Burkholderia mul
MEKRKKLTIRLTVEQYRKMTEKKSSLNFSKFNDFIISLINDDKSLFVNLHREIIFELSKQGSNLNQIARKANTDTSLSIEILEAIQKIKKQNEELLKYVSK